MSYRRLTPEQRYQIAGYLKTEMSLRDMAKLLDVSPSTISRELRRNDPRYDANKASKAARLRRVGIGPSLKIQGSLKGKVDGFLKVQWSPELISHKLKSVSHETIYRYVFRDQQVGGVLYKNLRRGRKWRTSRKKLSNQRHCGSRPDRVKIGERPAIVQERVRVGDYERDLILGQSGRILTIVDRVSKLLMMSVIRKKLSVGTHEETVKLLKNKIVHTITNDNGHEFSLHKQTTQALRAPVYFADPHSSWQRGTNENTNGLIRQYLPKGTDFTKISNKRLRQIVKLLNNRPRKCLGYRTPADVHKELSRVLH